MKNNKIIHIRVSEVLYDGISNKAEVEGITISDYCRRQLSQSIEIEDPLHAVDLLFVFAYFEYNCGDYKSVSYEEAKHILNIIERHYPNLEPELQVVFDKVVPKISRYLEEFDLKVINDDTNLCFGKGEDSLNFNYTGFYKYINGKIPYR